MKSPDEIKKGLECCQHNPYNGLCDCHKGCPYRNMKCDTLRKDALAYIQQLEAAQPKWISVEDDIPTDDYDVLAWVGNKEIAIAWFDGYTGEWHAYGSYEGDVTHWMPLPSPPKEDE